MKLTAFFRIAKSAVGIGIGLAIALSLVAPPVNPFLLASLGGSAVFLFGLPSAHAAQPRALFGGHLSSACIGVVCYQMFGDAVWVYAVAQALALSFMLITRTIHPPAGANPLIMIYGHANYPALWQPVFVGVLTLAVVAAFWSRLVSGQEAYPRSWFEPSTYLHHHAERVDEA